MAKKFSKGDLVHYKDRFFVVTKETEEYIEGEDFRGDMYNVWNPVKPSQSDISNKINELNKEINFLKKYVS